MPVPTIEELLEQKANELPAVPVIPATDVSQYGARQDGTQKGRGFLGPIDLPDGGVATEYTTQSDAVTVNGQRIDFPTLVPTLTPQEIEIMRSDIIPNQKPIPEPIMKKAIQHANSRLANGLSVFADQAAPAPAVGSQQLSSLKLQAYLDKVNNKQEEKPVEEDKDLSSSDWGFGVARSFLEGMTLNWSDEAGIAIAAAAAAVTPGVEENYSTIYRKMKDDYDKQKATFQKQAPGVALASELSGGLAGAPLGLVGRGATGLNLLGRAAAEGAVAGAGAAEQGEVVEGALMGATIGTALSGTAQVIGKGINWASQRNIKTNLFDADGSFTPITLTEPATTTGKVAQAFYRGVGRTVGGGKIAEQERPILGRAREQVSEAAAEVNKAKVAQRQINEEVNLGIKQQRADAVAAITSAFDEANKVVASSKSSLKDRINALTSSIKPKALNSLDSVNNAFNAANHNFRKLAYLESFPVFGDKGALKDIEDALAKDPRQAIEILDNQWTVNGFSPFFKDIIRSEDTNLGSVLRSIQSRLDEDEGLKAAFGTAGISGDIMNTIRNVFSKEGTPSSPLIVSARIARGVEPAETISGKAFGNAYASFGRRANDKTADPNKRRAYRLAQETLVDILEKNLPKERFEKFALEKQKWKTLKVLRQVSEDTGLKEGVRGRWTTKDWVKASGKVGGAYAKRSGTGPLVREAESTTDAIKTTKTALTNKVRGEVEKRVRLLTKEMDALEKELVARQNLQRKTIEEAKRTIRVDPGAAERLAQAQLALKQTEQKLSSVKEHSIALKRKSVSENSYQNTLGLVGQTFGAIRSLVNAPVVNIASGAAQAALARPSTQRVVAGQTAAQEAIQRQIQSEGGQAVKRALSTRLPALVSGMLTEQ